jgi:hypothetical protein
MLNPGMMVLLAVADHQKYCMFTGISRTVLSSLYTSGRGPWPSQARWLQDCTYDVRLQHYLSCIVYNSVAVDPPYVHFGPIRRVIRYSSLCFS